MTEISSYFNSEYLRNLYDQKLSNSKAKGIDKKNSVQFKKDLEPELAIIVRKVNEGTYLFSPFLEKLKLKGRGKLPRVISIPTVRDRVVLLVLKEILHTAFPESVNRKLPNSYIRDIKEYLNRSSGPMHFIKLDIEKFYDNIDRRILLQKLRVKNLNSAVIDLIEQAINTPTVPIHLNRESYVDFKTESGIPQGLSISNILAQIYLSEVDRVIDKRKYFYRRYVDDMLIINQNEISEFRFKNIEKELNRIKLNLNHSKTEKDFLSKGFVFLGYKISSKKISIADSNIETLLRRIAGKFTWLKNGIANPSTRPNWLNDDKRFKEVFLEELNESITGIISADKNYGWLFYFSEITDESLMFRLDNIISRFFNNIKAFDYRRPDSVKRLSRAFKVIKYDRNKNYIANYDKLDSIKTKRDYLIYRGKLDPEVDYSDSEIDTYFERFRKKQTQKVEQDIGYNYY